MPGFLGILEKIPHGDLFGRLRNCRWHVANRAADQAYRYRAREGAVVEHLHHLFL